MLMTSPSTATVCRSMSIGDAPALDDALVESTSAWPTTQHGPHAREQLARRVRLRDVVVGAELETHDDVDLGVLRGEHDDRDVLASSG
jgi:hypothetical protein